MKRLASIAISAFLSVSLAFAAPLLPSTPTQTKSVSGVGSSFLASQGSPTGPCDILLASGNPCVAAHSVTRLLYSLYSGPLFQLKRQSDSTTVNVFSTASGLYNAAAVASFCLGTNCVISEVYDQSGNANHLPSVLSNFAANATPGNPAPWTISYKNGLPVLLTYGQKAAYRNRSGVNIPTNASSSATYEVMGTDVWSTCCGGYGRMENFVASACGTFPTDATCPPGSMWATGMTTYSRPNSGSVTTLATPGPTVDFEYLTYGNVISAIPSVVSMLSEYNGSTGVGTNYWGDATKSTINQSYQWTPYITPVVENGLSLGEGGDSSVAAQEFFEGAVTNGAPSASAVGLLQANVAAFYGSQTAPVQTPTDVLINAGGVTGGLQLDPSLVVAGCWSLRKCRNGYTGYAALLTRASDSTTLNVGFTPTGDFDDQSAQSFCAGTTCYAKVYNQALLLSGNTTGTNNDQTATQSGQTQSQFATINFNALNGRTVLSFNGSQILSTPSGMSGVTVPLSVSWVGERTGATSAQADAFVSFNRTQGAFGWGAAANTAAIIENGTSCVTAAANDNTWGSFAATVTSTGASLIVNNGTPATATCTTYGISSYSSIGGNFGFQNPLTGNIAEVILMTTALTSAQITALYQNQRAYYGNQF